MRKSCTNTVRAERNHHLWLRERRVEQRAVKYLTKPEVEAVFCAIPKENARDRLLFNLIYRHGLRRLEATLLWVDDVQDGKLWIARAKGGISGSYPLHPDSRDLLRAYAAERRKDECPYLFRGKRHTNHPLSVEAIDHLFRNYAAKACISEDRRHVHVLRHSIGVHLANAGWDISDVQDWLGHKEITSTMIYFQITNKRREARFRESMRSREIARVGAW